MSSKDQLLSKGNIVDGDMEADVTGSAIECKNFENVRFQMSWTDTASPVGTLIVQGSEDGVTFHPVTLTAVMFDDLSADATLSADGDIDLDGTAAGGCLLNIKDPYRYMRVFWDVTSGGAADLLNVIAGAR